jgi:hypothetical protein
MLVPLETLSGWPRVENPPALYSLLLFFGFPILVFLVVIAINKIVQTIHATRGDDPRTSDPLWVGAQESAEIEPIPDSKPSEQTVTTTGGSDVEGDDTGEHVGGAGARW